MSPSKSITTPIYQGITNHAMLLVSEEEDMLIDICLQWCLGKGCLQKLLTSFLPAYCTYQ